MITADVNLITGKVIAIIDAYSTGNKLCRKFIELGANVIHIQSTNDIPNILAKSFIPSDFIHNHIYLGNIDHLLAELNSYLIDFVLAGSETGVQLADQISNALNLEYQNEFSLSLSRRDKYEMIESTRKYGINSVKQIKSGNDQELLLWAKKQKKWPLVVKPLNSSSSDGFSICRNIEDFTKAYTSILGKTNILGFCNKEILAQECLQGTQYVVNSVSRSGQHYFTDLWEMQTRHTEKIPMIIDSMTLISKNTTEYKELIEYMISVLDSLGIRNGPVHSEVMFTESGPYLIEVNCRLMGGNIDDCFKIALNNYDQIDAFIDSLADPIKLHNKLHTGCVLKINLSEVDFAFYHGGKFKKFLKKDEIKKLQSFHSFSMLPDIGEYVDMTSDTTNSAGLLYLMHEDRKTLIEDRDTVVNWQRMDMLFEIGESHDNK